MSKYIDLSQQLNNNTLVYPGDPVVIIRPVFNYDKEGFSVHSYQFGGHTGTHIDAATHFIKGGKNLNEYPLEKFTGEGKVIDARGYTIIDIDILKGTAIKKESVVLFWTDYVKKIEDPKYFENYPILTGKLVDFLVKSGVKMVGMDAPSFDSEPEFPVHKKLLGNDVLMIEGLCNLELVYKKKFKVYAFPIKVGTDGVPVRVVGELI